jgi:hypothetical protein
MPAITIQAFKQANGTSAEGIQCMGCNRAIQMKRKCANVTFGHKCCKVEGACDQLPMYLLHLEHVLLCLMLRIAADLLVLRCCGQRAHVAPK